MGDRESRHRVKTSHQPAANTEGAEPRIVRITRMGEEGKKKSAIAGLPTLLLPNLVPILSLRILHSCYSCDSWLTRLTFAVNHASLANRRGFAARTSPGSAPSWRRRPLLACRRATARSAPGRGGQAAVARLRNRRRAACPRPAS